MHDSQQNPDRLPSRSAAAKTPLPCPASPDDPPRNTADEWAEESARQAAALRRHADEFPQPGGAFAEFRRKLARGEALSRALARLAEALRFSGRITIFFHQGKVTKTVLEELHLFSGSGTRAGP